MIISVASGKGGTGKTTIAVNLALALEKDTQYIDCDVEEPNGHIFLTPDIQQTSSAGLPIPVVNPDKCDHCGECAKICQFNAIAALKQQTLVFPDLCHSCGGCWLVCPHGAISKKEKEIGVVETGAAGMIAFAQGKLKIGETMAPSLIRAVKRQIDKSKIAIIDAPPGTSCPVIEALKSSAFILLVTEPTPFGLNDLKLAVAMVSELKIPFGVVINRADIGDTDVREYCKTESIPILLEINNDRAIAEAYSRGIPMIKAFPEFRPMFLDLYRNIERRAGA